jgi:1,4-alpha-glucan branching enzyme
VQIDDDEESTVSYLRYSKSGESVLVSMNLTPVPRHDHLLGVPTGGLWSEVLNSDSTFYGGSGVGNLGGVQSTSEPWGDYPHRVALTLPPLSLVILKAGSP